MNAATMVRQFHEKFGLPIGSQLELPDDGERDLRYSLLQEEWEEYAVADAEGADDIVAVADALADMVFVIYGTALSYGIDLDAVLAEVHRSNMSKELDPLMAYPAKCVIKGPDYSPPDIPAALSARKEHE